MSTVFTQRLVLDSRTSILVYGYDEIISRYYFKNELFFKTTMIIFAEETFG